MIHSSPKEYLAKSVELQNNLRQNIALRYLIEFFSVVKKNPTASLGQKPTTSSGPKCSLFKQSVGTLHPVAQARISLVTPSYRQLFDSNLYEILNSALPYGKGTTCRKQE